MNTENVGFSSVQKWTLLSTILGSSMVFIDSTALNVALPALQQDLNITGTELLWVINGYALFLSALLLVGGSLGDLYGRNKVFLIGLTIFSLSSLACGISQNAFQIIIARAIQGIGGALLTPGSLSIISSQFGPESRGRAIGLWSTFSALTAVFGPILGGWLAGVGLWRVIFFINIPLAIIVFIGMITQVPESKTSSAGQLDFLGALFVTIGLAGVTYGFIESSNYGFSSLLIMGSLGIGGLSLAAFLLVQSKSSHPMMPLNLFKSSTFGGTNLMTLFVYGALGGAMFFLPLNLIQIQGYSEVSAGMAMLPIIILIASISPFMGKFVDRNGCKTPLTVGPVIAAIGFYLFSKIGITGGVGDYWHTFFISFALLGLGMGITVAPLTTAVMGAVTADNAGIASGINNTIARAAGVLAIALMGAMVLLAFKTDVIIGLESVAMEEDVKLEIVLETLKFTAAEAPASLNKEDTVIVDHLFKMAFVNSFNKAVNLASLLMLLGGVLAFISIKNSPRATIK
jgi:EmrB/QacA subfamily drug resistance transporter